MTLFLCTFSTNSVCLSIWAAHCWRSRGWMFVGCACRSHRNRQTIRSKSNVVKVASKSNVLNQIYAVIPATVLFLENAFCLLGFRSFNIFTSFFSTGFERRRQHQQVLRRSYVVGAGQAGRGVELPHVIEKNSFNYLTHLSPKYIVRLSIHPSIYPGSEAPHRYCLILASSVPPLDVLVWWRNSAVFFFFKLVLRTQS